MSASTRFCRAAVADESFPFSYGCARIKATTGKVRFRSAVSGAPSEPDVPVRRPAFSCPEKKKRTTFCQCAALGGAGGGSPPSAHAQKFLCPQVSRGERALSQSSSNSSFLSDVRTSNDSSMGATQWQFQRAENPWSTVLRCVAPALGLVCDQDARFPSVPFCRHARTLADANTHWQSLSLR